MIARIVDVLEHRWTTNQTAAPGPATEQPSAAA
jgi:hypothetical protein